MHHNNLGQDGYSKGGGTMAWFFPVSFNILSQL
jgi:hypothetical protein